MLATSRACWGSSFLLSTQRLSSLYRACTSGPLLASAPSLLPSAASGWLPCAMHTTHETSLIHTRNPAGTRSTHKWQHPCRPATCISSSDTHADECVLCLGLWPLQGTL